MIGRRDTVINALSTLPLAQTFAVVVIASSDGETDDHPHYPVTSQPWHWRRSGRTALQPVLQSTSELTSLPILIRQFEREQLP